MMFYETQLRLLRDTFRKCRIQTNISDLPAPPVTQNTIHTQDIFGGNFDLSTLLQQLVPEVKPATVYEVRDFFDCRYLLLNLPELPAKVLCIGPYLSSPPTSQLFMEWAENKGITSKQQKLLESYYVTLPLLPESSHLFMLLEAFYEHLWGPNGFTVEYISWESLLSDPLLTEAKTLSEEDDALLRMKNIEQRYEYENELMNAVSQGQVHRVNILLQKISTILFQQRVADPIRNIKNYCIIMNTLLRKAAEKGGVHPMYLDSISSKYAIQIEQLLTMEQVGPLITEMYRSYCHLVLKYSIQNYSHPVQQALIYIDTNLTDNLNLQMLSKSLNISNSYLSTLFKKEIGTTLTDYIAHRRIEQAMELLRTTHLQIQSVAQHCGIMDVHYFSKIFKKITGLTPLEYRHSLKGSP